MSAVDAPRGAAGGHAGFGSAHFARAHAEPWASSFVDLESLNAAATDVVVQRVRELRRRARSGTVSAEAARLLILGPAGVGKTHLFTRLRRKLQPRAVLVHVRPLIGSEMTPRFLLGQMLEQLGYDSFGLRQIDMLVGAALALVRGQRPEFPRAYLDELAEIDADARTELLENALEHILERQQGLDESWLRRLLGVPFARPLQRSAALSWLGGRELDDVQAKRLGVKESLTPDQVPRALRTLAVVAAPVAPIVLVFDQLENLIDPERTGSRVLAYGNLVADLVDVVRELVVVQMALDTEWKSDIEPKLGLSHRTRVVSEVLPLSLPTPAECEALLGLWVNEIADRPEPFPWPFGKRELSATCAQVGMTPRMLMYELQAALDRGGPEEEPSKAQREAPCTVEEALRGEWQKHLDHARRQIDEAAAEGRGPEPAHLRDAVAQVTTLVEALRTTGATGIESADLTTRVGPIRLAFVLQASARSTAIFLARLRDAGVPLLAVRERWRDFPPTWRTTHNAMKLLLEVPGVRFRWLDRSEAAELLALRTLLMAARSRDVSGPEGRPCEPDAVERWILGELQPAAWPFVRELAGAPETAPGRDLDADSLPPPAPGDEAAPPPATREAPAVALLDALRVASIERLVRELAQKDASVSRAEVVAALRAVGPGVRWFGEALVSRVSGGKP